MTEHLPFSNRSAKIISTKKVYLVYEHYCSVAVMMVTVIMIFVVIMSVVVWCMVRWTGRGRGRGTVSGHSVPGRASMRGSAALFLLVLAGIVLPMRVFFIFIFLAVYL